LEIEREQRQRIEENEKRLKQQQARITHEALKEKVHNHTFSVTVIAIIVGLGTLIGVV